MKAEQKKNVSKAQSKKWESYRNKQELFKMNVQELKAMKQQLWDEYSKIDAELEETIHALPVKQAEEQAWSRYWIVSSILALKSESLDN